MLDLTKVEDVRALLAQGRSQRGTARDTGVSRGTVATIAHDRWAPYHGERAKRELTSVESPSPAAIVAAAKQAAAKRDPEPIRELFQRYLPPTLELRPDERHRYLEIRRRLVARGEAAPVEREPLDAA